MNEYRLLTRELGRVRRAWKRTAALSGLAIVVVEGLGISTVALLVELLFRPEKAGRIALLALVGVLVVGLLVRHLVSPVTRRISDEQMALYVEEHAADFEGALLAAAEFGPEADSQQRAMVEAILRQAVARARKRDVRTAVDLRRLKKHGALAAVVCLLYVGLGVLFPEPVSKHARRLLVPWEEPVEEVAIEHKPPPPPPIEFTLSREDAKLLRGSPFALEARLSRAPEGPVNFHLRSVETKGEQSKWQVVPMKEVEKLHTYAFELTAVNEATEFYVSAEGRQSKHHRLDVYDPLVLEGLTVTVRYPAYLQRPNQVEKNATGDVRAPMGSVVTLTVAPNRSLSSGTLTWASGGKQSFHVRGKTAATSFTVSKDASYTFEVKDALGQSVRSPGPCSVTALPDAPPTVELIRPSGMVSATPLTELTFEARVTDDFGVAAVELVLRRGLLEKGAEQRLPLTLVEAGGASDTARLLVELEKLEPPAQPREVLTYHVAARDQKQQEAVTEMGLLAIRPFEVWTTEMWEPPATGEVAPEPPELPPFLTAAWALQRLQSTVPEEQVNRQAEELAEQMVNPDTGQVWVFVEPEGAVTKQDADYVNTHAKKGRQALTAHKLKEAVEELRLAVTRLVALGLAESLTQELAAAGGAAAGGGGAQQPPPDGAAEQLEALDAAASEAEAGSEELAEQIDEAQEARELAQQVAELQQRQSELVVNARDLPPQQPTDTSATPVQKQARQDWTNRQERLAQQAREVGDQARQQARSSDSKQHQQAAEGLARAAQKMQEASRQMKAGRTSQATREATRAEEELAAVQRDLAASSEERFADILNEAERRAKRAVDQQTEVNQKTQRLAADQPAPAAAKQQFQALAKEQAAIKGQVSTLERTLTRLNEAAQQSNVKRETAAYVEEARQDLRRSRVDRRVTDAAVELTLQEPGAAKGQQEKALEALARVLDKVRRANDSLASDETSQLRRVRSEAQQAQEALAQLNPNAARKTGAKPPPPPTGKDRDRMAEDTKMTLKQMERHLQARKLVKPQTMSRLEEFIQSRPRLTEAVAGDTERSVGLLETVKDIRSELERKYENLLKSKRLLAAQSEECPPQYRGLVNSYFEALSKSGVSP